MAPHREDHEPPRPPRSPLRIVAAVLAVLVLAVLFAYCTAEQGRRDVPHVGVPASHYSQPPLLAGRTPPP